MLLLKLIHPDNAQNGNPEQRSIWTAKSNTVVMLTSLNLVITVKTFDKSGPPEFLPQL